MSKAGKQGNHRVPQAESQPGFMARFALGCCIGCFVFAICGAIAHRLGYRTLAEVFAMSAFVSMGQFFVWAAVYSAQTNGVVYRRVRESWFSGRSRREIFAVRQSQPIKYWSITAIPILLGIGLMIGTVVATCRRWLA